MIRFLGVCVAVLGIASLVFGIIFIVMANSAKAEVVDEIAAEGYPMFGPNPAYPYLGLTAEAVANGDIIDTVEDIDNAADILADGLHAMVPAPAGLEGFQILFNPSTIETVLPDGTVTSLEAAVGSVDTLKLHEYTALLGFTSVLGLSQMGLGMASLMQFVGIVSIIVGVALMLTGLLVFKLAPVRE